jgi:uncharacterized protein YjbI with pentapeptide repeats
MSQIEIVPNAKQHTAPASEVSTGWVGKLIFRFQRTIQFFTLMSAAISITYGVTHAVLTYDRERTELERDRISRAWGIVAQIKTQGQSNLGLTEAIETINQRNVDLAQIQLGRTYLSKVQLPMAAMDRAELQSATLEMAKLCGAHLSQADLQDANLRGADLRGAQLDGANLRRANLRGVDLTALSLPPVYNHPIVANLRGADLEGADLSGANLAGADLRAARLSGATMFRANLQGAYLQLADLQRAKLSAADLAQANLSGAVMSDANLRGAALTGAILEATQLDQAHLLRADFSDAWGVPDNIASMEVCFNRNTWFAQEPHTRTSDSSRRLCGPPELPTSMPDPRPRAESAGVSDFRLSDWFHREAHDEAVKASCARE